MTLRPQRTLARPVEVRGFGLFGSRDVVLRALPAPPHHGIAFQRVDLPGQPRIPALISYVQPRPRRTAIARGSAAVETIEHVMAALAGLQIDNCLVQLDAPEPPCGDGSAALFTAAFLEAGIRSQLAVRRCFPLHSRFVVQPASGPGSIQFEPDDRDELTLRFELDYPEPRVGRQSHSMPLTPELFATEIAPARTFVLDREVEALRAQGYGARATTDNLNVLGPDGPRSGPFRFPNECARHKLLDLLGDLALVGCGFTGTVIARQSGHALNHAAARRLSEQCEIWHQRRSAR